MRVTLDEELLDEYQSLAENFDQLKKDALREVEFWRNLATFSVSLHLLWVLFFLALTLKVV